MLTYKFEYIELYLSTYKSRSMSQSSISSSHHITLKNWIILSVIVAKSIPVSPVITSCCNQLLGCMHCFDTATNNDHARCVKVMTFLWYR